MIVEKIRGYESSCYENRKRCLNVLVFWGRLKTRCLVEKLVEYCGKGRDISVIQGVKSIRTRKTLVSENMKEKRNKRKVSGSYLRKKRFGIFCLICI